MPKTLGFSLYLSTFAVQWPTLRGWAGTGAPVFLSLHIGEEFHETYCQQAADICRLLVNHGFQIVADVSVKTVEQFGCRDLTELAERLGLWALRIDYGFSADEIGAMAQRMPIVLNASTTSAEDGARVLSRGRRVSAMHNFYPRPETGLDEELLMETTKGLQGAGLEVLAFIPGDTRLRGPVFAGLPTLEAHRSCLPSAAFADLHLRFGVDGVFLADPGLSEKEQRRIALFCTEDVLSVPAELEPGWEHLYDQVFTCRVDSPKWLVRFQESRTYSCAGSPVEPGCCGPRTRGCITIDNVNYGRYTGELQMIRSPLPADRRVNVIGGVPENAWLLMDCVKGGQKFMLVHP